MGFDFKWIEYVPGSSNEFTDCVFCLPQPSTSVHPGEKGNEAYAIIIDNLSVTAKLFVTKTAKDIASVCNLWNESDPVWDIRIEQ